MASVLGLHYLLRSVCPNTEGKFGNTCNSLNRQCEDAQTDLGLCCLDDTFLPGTAYLPVKHIT